MDTDFVIDRAEPGPIWRVSAVSAAGRSFTRRDRRFSGANTLVRARNATSFFRELTSGGYVVETPQGLPPQSMLTLWLRVALASLFLVIPLVIILWRF
jgi:hypothetical protein